MNTTAHQTLYRPLINAGTIYFINGGTNVAPLLHLKINECQWEQLTPAQNGVLTDLVFGAILLLSLVNPDCSNIFHYHPVQ